MRHGIPPPDPLQEDTFSIPPEEFTEWWDRYDTVDGEREMTNAEVRTSENRWNFHVSVRMDQTPRPWDKGPFPLTSPPPPPPNNRNQLLSPPTDA